ncbi:MAG TPA: phosphatase PAP2 family protein [Chitinophagaceae bacterium]|nr:phosphatase PAP2 family protein [Chitinophagaceae bacterium]HNN31105.1 phosphatase PAP2 family protein [Chitinophagaceae bacterium]
MIFVFLNSFFEWLDKADKQLFLLVNKEWTNTFLDNNLPWYRDSTTWLPLYLFLLLFVIFNYGKKSLPWIIAVAITATISDQISSNFLKNLIERPRPCNDVFIQHLGRLLLNRCPSSFSFTSSHAVNHFTAAMFIFTTLKPAFGKYATLFPIWAATICYAQVYVGVHYPLDVFAGAIAGCCIGIFAGKWYNKYYSLQTI